MSRSKKDDVQNLVDEIWVMHEELENSENENDIIRKELGSLKNYCEELEGKIEDLEEKISELEDEVQQLITKEE